MPEKVDKINLPENLDRRRKLTDAQKDEIRHKYETGFYSLNGLAKEYEVSKKTILLIVNPDSKRKSDDRIKEHWKDYQPSKQERARIMREHRNYKKQLLKSGMIAEENDDGQTDYPEA